MTDNNQKLKKKQELRNNEYYDYQAELDKLYAQSKAGYKFRKLYDLIIDERNIKLAYRNIKKNYGSKTSGTNENTIIDIGGKDPNCLIQYVRHRMADFKPHSVRRVEIPKQDGSMRPLGIPTIEDRIIQQCMKQILEPICEAKFYQHSYGFRPNRGANHALSRAVSLVNKNKLHYVVDIDIKGFFDNVEHGKLLKQLWSLGVQDKRVISILSKMLKAEVKGIGIPNKGTPQGGIISPLLSNVVLNELDWWISSQWETFETKKDYNRERMIGERLVYDQSAKYRAIKQTGLKEMFIVRYADDFKIFCRNHKDAFIIFEAVKKWLKDRLGLETSPEKSKVINLRRKHSEFLGFKMKAIPKKKKFVAKTNMSEKAKKKAVSKLRDQIKKVGNSQKEVSKLNAMIVGIQNYYRYATHITVDFSKIGFSVRKTLYNRNKAILSQKGMKSNTFKKLYPKFIGKVFFIHGINVFPIDHIRTKYPTNFSQDISNYTILGRQKVHDQLKGYNQAIIYHLMRNPIPDESIEYNDNRVSLYVGQLGKCGVTKLPLEIGDMEVHHKTPRSKGGSDEYKNLIFIRKDVHKLIHSTEEATIQKYLQKLNLDSNILDKINKFRKLVGNDKIAA
ncbi:group II intron reverse transcriptase/maturase [Metabacillus fastidiosus]|uniref:group II intron reverse transcriptase/maturase n=1 Tax=Metabacillus fastidiosus TaxID=1458 RepID=UPI002DBF8AF8|nr:group II intron reverse transcriptase/maturase [Metabacillus fastidiosus]MEC2075038.1 group II intron reverse transcriptase/maturase [Metabacillus fastidiosus]